MGFHALSFLLGLGAAAAMPVLTRVFRPAAVQLLVAGMGAIDEVRRVVAEQVELIEDIAAEARAKREESLTEVAPEPSNGSESEATAARPARRLRRQRA
jgi:hypothetical protein